MHEGRRQTGRRPAHAGSRLKLIDVLGRSRLIRQPSSRTGENPPYGMTGGIEETSASFEARSAPRSHPTKAEVERASQQSEAMKIDAAGEMFSLSAWHLSEWRGPHPDLVGGFERDSAPIQKKAEHIEPADHKHDLARDRLTVLI